MRTLSRWLRRWDMLRVSAAALAVTWIALVGAYGFGAASSGFSLNAGLAAAAAVAIAAAGFLYAWRGPAPIER